MNTPFAVKPNLGFTIARRPQLPPPSFSRLNLRSFGFKDTFHGPLLMRQHHNIHFAKDGSSEEETFSLLNPYMTKRPVCKRTPSKLSTYKILGPGIILLEQYVSLKDQADIVNMCEKCGGFYKPCLEEGEDLRIHTCFGRNWDPETRYKNRYRRDGSEPPPIPYQIFSLAANAIEDAQAHLDELPSTCPNACLVTFYRSVIGGIGLHRDLDEGFSNVTRGLPVVSIFIGNSAEFAYRLNSYHTRGLKTILLRSGDVLIYGGENRDLYHGVTEVHLDTMPQPLYKESALKSGCLNLSLREF